MIFKNNCESSEVFVPGYLYTGHESHRVNN